MTRTSVITSGIAGWFAVLGGLATSAHDNANG